ncbi:hypothetical protein FBU30_010590 [Linnemannia zychae]|nr:hypothetical protein FBU30_010590 [Linnemannia zychae]
MSAVRMVPRSRDSSDAGSPAPRIRVGYKRQSDIPDSMNQSQAYSQGSNRESMYRPSSTYSNSSRDLLHQQQHQQSPYHHSQHQTSPRRLAHSPSPPSVPPLLEMDRTLNIIAELLTETVLLPRESIVDSSPFLSTNRLDLYDQDPVECAKILRDERRRIMERRQGVELELLKQETAQALLKAEETSVQNRELATETMAIAPESLVPLSQSRTKLLDDLGNILSKIRGILETVHIQFEEELELQYQQRHHENGQHVLQQKKQRDHGNNNDSDVVLASIEKLHIHQQNLLQQQQQNGQYKERTKAPVAMDVFQMHGLMDLYDREPEKCIELLRVEHARLAARRDELELEYERQRTALLRSMQR